MTGDLQFLHKSFHSSSVKDQADKNIVGLSVPKAGEKLFGIVGRSQQMGKIFHEIRSVADADMNLLIQGPVGVGKKMIARAVYRLSSKSLGEFGLFNFKANAGERLESELLNLGDTPFVEKINFCQNGLLLLEEVGKMPQKLQEKLLHYCRSKTNVRFVATTSENLQEAVTKGVFCGTLLEELSGKVIEVSSLSQRKEDIRPLLSHFYSLYGHGEDNVFTIEHKALECLMDYHWPGNVEELENVMERIMALDRGPTNISDLPSRLLETFREKNQDSQYSIPLPKEGINLRATLRTIEDSLIKQAIERTEGNKNKASKLLGLNRTTLIEKLKKHMLQ